MTTRRLTPEQQGYVEQALPLVEIVVATFIRRHGGTYVNRCDLSAAAQQACCLAALTYDPEKAGISAYFSVAMQRALMKEVVARQRHDRRMRSAWPLPHKEVNPHVDRMRSRASRALQFLDPYDKQLLEDYLIEGVTLERLGREQNLDKRTIKKRINRAIKLLREAEEQLP